MRRWSVFLAEIKFWQKHRKLDTKPFLPCPILLDFSKLFQIFCLDFQFKRLLNKFTKIFQILLSLNKHQIVSFFFLSKWNIWINVMQVNKSCTLVFMHIWHISQIHVSTVWTSKHHLGRVSKTEKECDIIFFSNVRAENVLV